MLVPHARVASSYDAGDARRAEALHLHKAAAERPEASRPARSRPSPRISRTCSWFFAAAALRHARLGGTARAFAFSAASLSSSSPSSDDVKYADWTYIYVPYCTGDLHWGNATVTYQGGVTIEHRGAVNADAAASWMQAALPTPDVLLVSGCSAGAYGSLLWGARLARTYVPRGAATAAFGDPGVGVVTDASSADAYPGWNCCCSVTAMCQPRWRAGDER